MEKLPIKERVAIYLSIDKARKEFFKKLKDNDLGEIQVQDIQMKALEPVTTKIEDVRKQAKEIYNGLVDYFEVNRMDEELEELKNIFNEIKNVNQQLVFVKEVLDDILEKQTVDFDEATKNAARARSGSETKEESELQEEKEGPIKPGLQTTKSAPISSIGQVQLARLKVPPLKRMVKDKWPNAKNVDRLRKRGLIQILLTDFPNVEAVNERIRLIIQKYKAEKTEQEMPIAPLGAPTGTPISRTRSIGEEDEEDEGFITGEEEEEGKKPVAVDGRGMKRKRGRPKKTLQKGKGVKKKHLVNSLILHRGSKAAGNNNLDNDIKNIINRMYKNKMITAAQKKELLNKYI